MKQGGLCMNKKNIIIIIGVIAVIIAGGAWWMSSKKSEPVVVFKDNITFQLGQTSFESDPPETTALPPITTDSIIDASKSSYDEVSFNKIGCGNAPMTMEYRFIAADELGDGTGTLYARKGDVCKTFEFPYVVVE